jgi:hypothetical protein
MQIKKGLEICSGDFWYDLTDGGYLKPDEICENPVDVEKVKQAIAVLMDFKESCENQIDGFIQ